MNKTLIILALIASTLGSCDTETELKKSVFIPDPDKPGLPLYSEWGYNTFGAYIDRATFVSNDDDTPGKFVIEGGVSTFSLNGHRSNSYSSRTLEFRLPGITADTYDDLVSLHEKTFNLLDEGTVVSMTTDWSQSQVEVIEGELKFQRAQHLIVDGTPFQVILSGTFELKLKIDNIPVTISDGRFDVGITEDSFYFLD